MTFIPLTELYYKACELKSTLKLHYITEDDNLLFYDVVKERIQRPSKIKGTPLLVENNLREEIVSKKITNHRNFIKQRK